MCLTRTRLILRALFICLYPLWFVFQTSCESTGEPGDPDGGSGDTDADGDTDSDSDMDGDTDGDTDTDTDGDVDTDTDTDADPQIDGCSLAINGATGGEPNGFIPVCCTPSSSQKQNIEEVFALLNAHRQANGVAPLSYDDKLEETMQGHCMHQEIHPFESHYAPTSEPNTIYEPWDRADLCGTQAWAENIAWGYQTPEAVMDGWISSPGHNENMLNPEYTYVGIGEYNLNWGQIFR